MITLRKGNGKQIVLPKGHQYVKINVKGIKYQKKRGYWNKRMPIHILTKFCQGSGMMFCDHYYLYSTCKRNKRDGKIFSRTYKCFSFFINKCPAKIKEYVDSEEISVWSHPHQNHSKLIDVVPFFTVCMKEREFEFASVSFLRLESSENKTNHFFSRNNEELEEKERLYTKDFLFDATNLLLNICSSPGDLVLQVLKYNVIPSLKRIISESKISYPIKLRESAIWCIGNISGESSQARKLLINCDVFSLLVDILDEHLDFFRPYLLSEIEKFDNPTGEVKKSDTKEIVLVKDMKMITKKIPDVFRNEYEHSIRACELQHLFWTISNFFRGKDSRYFTLNDLINITEKLSMFLCYYDEEALKDVLWALSFILDDDNVMEELVCFLPLTRLVKLIEKNERIGNTKITTPLIRIFGNLSTGKATLARQVVESGVIGVMLTILKGSSCNINEMKEIAWSISNLCCEGYQVINFFIKQGLFEVLIKKFMASKQKTYHPVKVEILYVVNNTLSRHVDKEDVRDYFIEELDIFNSVLRILGKSKRESINSHLVFESLKTLKELAEKSKKVIIRFDDYSVEVIKNFAKSHVSRISEMSKGLLRFTNNIL